MNSSTYTINLDTLSLETINFVSYSPSSSASSFSALSSSIPSFSALRFGFIPSSLPLLSHLVCPLLLSTLLLPTYLSTFSPKSRFYHPQNIHNFVTTKFYLAHNTRSKTFHFPLNFLTIQPANIHHSTIHQQLFNRRVQKLVSLPAHCPHWNFGCTSATPR